MPLAEYADYLLGIILLLCFHYWRVSFLLHWADLRKRPTLHLFKYLITHNFWTVIGMGFKLGWSKHSLIITEDSLKFRAPPTSLPSGTGTVSMHITCGRKLAVLYLTSSVQWFGQELTRARMVCLVEGLICKPEVRGFCSFCEITVWKVPKFSLLHQVGPFLKSGHILLWK